MARPSTTVDDYLQAIYSLEDEGETVISARLARRMRVTPPTAWATIRRMVRDDFVTLDKKKVIRLTPKGHELAEDIVKRHRLAERFLCDVLGDGWVPWLITHEQLPECLAYIREQPGFQKRTQPFDVYQGLTILNVEDYTHRVLGPHKAFTSRDQIIEEIGLLAEMGVTVTSGAALGPASSLEEYLEQIEWFTREIMPLFKK